jgi:hypothetical protein
VREADIVASATALDAKFDTLSVTSWSNFFHPDSITDERELLRNNFTVLQNQKADSATMQRAVVKIRRRTNTDRVGLVPFAQKQVVIFIFTAQAHALQAFTQEWCRANNKRRAAGAP